MRHEVPNASPSSVSTSVCIVLPQISCRIVETVCTYVYVAQISLPLALGKAWDGLMGKLSDESKLGSL
jgi:hypothetical protein